MLNEHDGNTVLNNDGDGDDGETIAPRPGQEITRPGLEKFLIEHKDEFLDLWLAALTSGEYIQGQNHLRRVPILTDEKDKHQFCCLGVACDILYKHYNIGRWIEAVNKRFAFDINPLDGSTTGLPFDLTKIIPTLTNNRLVQLNDNYNYTFPMIAKYIQDRRE